MITLFFGENSFETQHAVQEIVDNFSGEVEKIDGSELQLASLPDVLMGINLFSNNRMLIIRDLSENKIIWPVFNEWVKKISNDIHIVLIERKLDKRSVTFKVLQTCANINEFQPLKDKDWYLAEKWVTQEAEKLDIKMNKKCVHLFVQRVGVDQWQLMKSLEKLTLVNDISEDVINEIIDANPVENVFNLFETAVNGNTEKLTNMIRVLEKTEGVFKSCALLSTQAFQLAVVASASKDDNVAKDFEIHPYVLSKLSSLAKRLGKSGVSKIILIFYELDCDIKLSKADSWLLVERALIKVANL